MHIPNAPARLLIPVVVACLLALAACGRESGAPEELSLAEIASRQQAYEDRDVRVRGTVHGFHDPRHYWLEDGHRNRVGLVPEDLIAPHLGREVTIVGRYTYARDRGRRISIATIEPYEPAR